MAVMSDGRSAERGKVKARCRSGSFRLRPGADSRHIHGGLSSEKQHNPRAFRPGGYAFRRTDKSRKMLCWWNRWNDIRISQQLFAVKTSLCSLFSIGFGVFRKIVIYCAKIVGIYATKIDK